MSINPREVYFQALNLYQQGNVDRAEQLCQKLLQVNAREVNSARLYGQILFRKGQLQQAQQILLQVLKDAPDYAHAYVDLARVMREEGELAESETYLIKAISLDRSLHGAKRLLHDVLIEQGKNNDAEGLAEELKERNKISEKVKIAIKLLQEKDYEKLERVGAEVLAQDPGNLAIMRILADYANQEFNSFRAVRLFRAILNKSQENWRAWNGLGRALTLQDRTEEAFECFKRSQEINPETYETHMLIADTHIKRYDYEKGITLYKQILQTEPRFNPARAQLGLALKTVGKQDEAIENFDICIENDDTYGEAYWSLSDMKTYVFSQDQINTMQRVLAEKVLSDNDQVYLGYALGKAYEHLNDYNKAFEYYQAANSVQKRIVDYNAAQNTELTDRIIRTFTPALFKKFDLQAVKEVTPIFIVGLPRSGSTLQEQILASHSLVEGTQELPYLPRLAKLLDKGKGALTDAPFPEGVDSLSFTELAPLAENYLSQAEFHRKQGCPYFIDKLPNNFSYIGLMALLFPGAKIINARRHPMDSCLGCYKQLWAMGQHFTYDLEDLGHYYKDYDRLMAHWHKILPGRILDVQYEMVVDDLESQVHRLLDYCGLPFEIGCIEFHKTQRAVKTSSSEQVRKPIYKSAVAYWENFGDKLDPLKAVLGDLFVE